MPARHGQALVAAFVLYDKAAALYLADKRTVARDDEHVLAAEILERLMARRRDGKGEAGLHLVGVKAIVHRETTFPLSNAGKLVQKAMAFIAKNAAHKIGERGNSQSTPDRKARRTTLSCAFRRTSGLYFRTLRS